VLRVAAARKRLPAHAHDGAAVGSAAKARAEPSAIFVKGFPGKDCGVPVMTGHYWLQTVPQTHALSRWILPIRSIR
jgi:hypothetical protein